MMFIMRGTTALRVFSNVLHPNEQFDCTKSKAKPVELCRRRSFYIRVKQFDRTKVKLRPVELCRRRIMAPSEKSKANALC